MDLKYDTSYLDRFLLISFNYSLTSKKKHSKIQRIQPLVIFEGTITTIIKESED